MSQIFGFCTYISTQVIMASASATLDLPGFLKYAQKVNDSLRRIEEELDRWYKYEEDYKQLDDWLGRLPKRTSHDIMVPFGKKAFMPGKMVHTNEILVLLGDNWFAERSASQAAEIVERRQALVKKTIETLKVQLEDSKFRAGMTPELYRTDNYELNEEGLPFIEIQEEIGHDEVEELERSKVHKPASAQNHNSFDRTEEEDEAAFRYLDELELAEKNGIVEEDEKEDEDGEEEEEEEEEEEDFDGVDEDDDIDIPDVLFATHNSEKYGGDYDENYEEAEESSENRKFTSMREENQVETTTSTMSLASAKLQIGSQPVAKKRVSFADNSDRVQSISTVRSPADIYQQMLTSKRTNLLTDTAVVGDPGSFEDRVIHSIDSLPTSVKASQPKKISRFKQAMIEKHSETDRKIPASTDRFTPIKTLDKEVSRFKQSRIVKNERDSSQRPSSTYSAMSSVSKSKAPRIINRVTEHETEPVDPEEVEDEMLLKEWQLEYHRRRQNLIATQGSFSFAEKPEIEVFDEGLETPISLYQSIEDKAGQDIQPRKISRFKAARLEARGHQ